VSRRAIGLWEGSPENTSLATHLLADLVDRGLDAEQGVLFVIDGAKAAAQAIRDVCGVAAAVQRCIHHQERNVLARLSERDRPAVRRRLRQAWKLDDHTAARDRRLVLAAELDRSHPGAAGSLREGLEETLTVTRLGVRGALKKTLASTNPCESMIECVRRTSRNVKRWQSGDMALRWTAAGVLEAEQQFRKLIGYRDLAKLALAVERQTTVHTPSDTPAPEVAALPI
jgi:putative transposase